MFIYIYIYALYYIIYIYMSLICKYRISYHISHDLFPSFKLSPVPRTPLGTACCRKVLCSASRNFPRRPKAALRLLKPTVSWARGQSRFRSPIAEITWQFLVVKLEGWMDWSSRFHMLSNSCGKNISMDWAIINGLVESKGKLQGNLMFNENVYGFL